MSDYFGLLNKDQAWTVDVKSSPTMQLGESARKAVGHIGKNNSWLDAYGQNDQKSWSDYYNRYRDAFQADSPGGYQSPGSSGRDGDLVALRYMDNIRSRDMEAQLKAMQEQLDRYQNTPISEQDSMNTWMQEYWAKQADRDQQFFDFMQENNQQGQLPGPEGGLYGDITAWANENNYGGRNDWTQQEVENAFSSSWLDPYLVAGEAGIPGYGDERVYQDIAAWANQNNYGGRNDWTREEAKAAFGGSGVDPYQAAREAGISGYVDTPAQQPAVDPETPSGYGYAGYNPETDHPVYGTNAANPPVQTPAENAGVYQDISAWANQTNYGGRNNWTSEEARAAFDGSGVDPYQAAREAGIAGYVDPPVQEPAVDPKQLYSVGLVDPNANYVGQYQYSEINLAGYIRRWAEANNVTNPATGSAKWAPADIMNLARDQGMTITEMYNELLRKTGSV